VTVLAFEPGPDELLCVVGPTASRKTELAVLACEQLGGEVIGADSVQVVRWFDIGSGKPTPEECARARHHLVGVLDPHEPVDAARFAAMADEAILEVRGRGRVPVVCGGSFLWVRALVYGLAKAPGASAEFRAGFRREVAALGREALHARLAKVDPVAAALHPPADLVRVERALEVHALTGRTLTSLHAEHREQAPRHRARFVGVAWEPALLEKRIRERAARWLGQGWIEEVRQLVAQGYRDTRAMGSVGYRQVLQHVQGELELGELEAAVVRATKVFARRQRTWLRDAPVTWVSPW
jgi:tRNA dimethylallyltransferase